MIEFVFSQTTYTPSYRIEDDWSGRVLQAMDKNQEPGLKFKFPVITGAMDPMSLQEMVPVQPMDNPSTTFPMSVISRRDRNSKWAKYDLGTLVEPTDCINSVKGEKTMLVWDNIRNVWTGTVDELADEICAEIKHLLGPSPDGSLSAQSTDTLVAIARDKFMKWVAPFGPGMQIVEFSTSDRSWASLAGRGGYAIIRGTQLVTAYVTRMS